MFKTQVDSLPSFEHFMASSDIIFIVCTLMDNGYEPISAREFWQLL